MIVDMGHFSDCGPVRERTSGVPLRVVRLCPVCIWTATCLGLGSPICWVWPFLLVGLGPSLYVGSEPSRIVQSGPSNPAIRTIHHHLP